MIIIIGSVVLKHTVKYSHLLLTCLAVKSTGIPNNKIQNIIAGNKAMKIQEIVKRPIPPSERFTMYVKLLR